MSQSLRSMSPEKMTALAKALGISQEKLTESVQGGTALPTDAASTLKIDDIIKNLWEKKADSNAFVLGCEFLKHVDKPSLEECSLLGNWFSYTSPLALAVGGLVRSDQPVDIVLQELQDLHGKMVQSGLVSHSDWLYSMACILGPLSICSPHFRAIAQVAIQQNWFEPANCFDSRAETLHDLLEKLDAVNELKPLVQRLLKNWYVHFLGRKRDKSFYIKQILGSVSPLTLPVYSGYSPTLEDGLKIDNLAPSWTEEPRGIPDIGRLFTGLPAFSVFKTRVGQYRSVILLGAPLWNNTSLKKKADELSEHYCQHRPDKEVLRERLVVISHKYSELIKKTFADYVYQTAHVNGGGITACWLGNQVGHGNHQVGHHTPHS
ncbi:hypothetical protein, partial [Sansalvadorimonas verongulae]|uniref:hypothetical protein n=1 Tax=Sansalvadorimonas verongulae TaxID=2172824 RepID=UPI0018AD2DB9